MLSKNRTLIKYILLFIFLTTFSIVIIFYNKNSSLDEEKDNIFVKSTNILNKYKKRTFDESEHFFLTYVKENKVLQNILSQELSDKEKFERIKQVFDKEIEHFKRHDYSEVSFYTKDGKAIYKSSYKEMKFTQSSNYKEIIKDISKEFKGKVYFLISDTSATLKYLRAVYDNTFKIKAIFELSIDLPKLIHETFIEDGYQVDFLFPKNSLKKSMSEESLASFKEHPFNNEYMYKNSFYSNRFMLDNLSYDLKNEIKSRMLKEEKFIIDYKIKDNYYINSFFPISNRFIQQDIYMFLYIKSQKYYAINERYNVYIILAIFLSLLLSTILYFLNTIYLKYKNIKVKLNSINTSIDKYVVVAETDLRGIVTYVSEYFCKTSGYKKEEIIGRPMNMIRNPDISKKFYDNMWKKLHNNEVWEGEIKNIDKNGNSYWVRGNISPMYNENNKKIGYRSIRVDISDEKQLLKVNSLLKRDLFLKLNEIKTRDKINMEQSKVILMGQILDAFSNEWKKPISNLSSKLLQLEDNVKNKNYDDKFLEDISKNLKDEVRNLSMHLNEFKTLFSHNDSSDRYSVYNVIKSTIASINKKDVEIKLDGDSSLETYGVSYDLRKIILGIIYNSLDEFNKKEIKEGKININVSRSNEFVLIKCEDNAGGIPEEFINKVFDLDFTTKNEMSSKGLPLHIAKLIVKKSGGDIWVKNVNKGCCFYIKLITQDRRQNERVKH
ncbi:hypothetical protein CP965_12135 [Halarcobacter mediterraneus]|uniref:histidine kinase n=1 Tax=Halarcobacter mediterraneus TaxID=2023153 RepID=A0A4V1M126_9BACT|nr:PAS domain-containing sensor histidine kinase [Halarcobacter mediterraneus]RXK11923.1 hypothetical protein CP965_12135 [Halarcobacter mediterraneus]